MSYNFIGAEEYRQKKIDGIVANLEKIGLVIKHLTDDNDILKNDNNYIQENVTDLSYSIGPETSVNIIETLSGLRVNINTINEQLDQLINVVKIAETNYESRRKAYVEGSILFDEVGRAYQTNKDGNMVVASGKGDSIDVNGVNYNGYFHDDWIGKRIASDMANNGSSELKNKIDTYYSAFNNLKIRSNNYAALSDNVSSRDSYISNLQSAEADLQKYLSDNGLPSLTTKS